MPYAKPNGQTTPRERLSRKLRDNRYRAAKLGCQADTITIAQAEAAGLLAQSWCYYCHTTLNGIYALDHKVSLYHGGPHTLSNIAKACTWCNDAKHIQDELDYLARLDRAS